MNISKWLLVISIFILIFCSCKFLTLPTTDDLNFDSKSLVLNNGTLKVSVNLNWGGAIDFISYQGGPNLVDRGVPDGGREIQVSLYDGNAYYDSVNNNNWYGQWGWNPVQAGDRKGSVTGHVDASKNGNLIYVRCRPLEWNGSGPSDIILEQWLSLEYQKAIKIHYRTTHVGNDYHAAGWQEFPCAYFKPTWSIPYIVIYQGNSLWTDDDSGIKKFPQPANMDSITSSENWIALVGEDNCGVTLYSQARDPVRFCLGVGRNGNTIPMNLIAAHTYFNPSGIYEATVFLVLGNWQEARKIIYAINGLGYYPNYYPNDTLTNGGQKPTNNNSDFLNPSLPVPKRDDIDKKTFKKTQRK